MNDDWDVVVVGGCNYDYLVRGAKIPIPGETSEGDEFQEAAGGKGANQAIGAARLGARVAFLSRLGSDSRGDACLRQLATEGVEHSGVVRDSEFPTGVALILVDHGGRKSIMTAPGANRRVVESDVRAQQPRLQRTKVVLAQLEVPASAVAAAFRICRQGDGMTVLDPAPAVPLSDELLALVDVIRPNSAEAEILTGIRVTDRTSAKRAAQTLMARGAGAAIVQAGDDGDLAVWREGEQWLPRLPVASIDATGAGDAFASALAVCLAQQKSLADAVLFANAAAALATTKLGAQAGLPRHPAVVELLKQSGISWPAEGKPLP
jgi:ribokinase